MYHAFCRSTTSTSRTSKIWKRTWPIRSGSTLGRQSVHPLHLLPAHPHFPSLCLATKPMKTLEWKTKDSHPPRQPPTMGKSARNCDLLLTMCSWFVCYFAHKETTTCSWQQETNPSRSFLIPIKGCEELNCPFYWRVYFLYSVYRSAESRFVQNNIVNIQFKRINEYSSGKSPTLNTTDVYNGIMLLSTSISNGYGKYNLLSGRWWWWRWQFAERENVCVSRASS